MHRASMQQVLYAVFNECDALRNAGQAEYAHNDADAFANFKRVGESLQLDQKQVLLVCAMKHWDGVASYVAGTVSQREDVTGRINDLIVYLGLLRGMIEEERGNASYFDKMADGYFNQPTVGVQRPPRAQPLPFPEDEPFVADPRD